MRGVHSKSPSSPTTDLPASPSTKRPSTGAQTSTSTATQPPVGDRFEPVRAKAQAEAQALGQGGPAAETRLQQFVQGQGPVNILTEGPKIRHDLSAMDPELAAAFRKADHVTQDLYGRPMQILPKPANVAHSISYAHGNVYLDPKAPRGQLVGGLIFEANNAVRDHVYQGIEKDWKSGKIMKSDASAYGITDPAAQKRFNAMTNPHERRALAQEFHEWDHMVHQSVPQQNRTAARLGNDPWVKYLDTINGDKLQKNGAWSSFDGYLKDSPGHYNAVHTAVAQSPGADEALAAAQR